VREGGRERGRTEGSREGGRERGEMQPASTAVLPGGRVSIIPFCTTSSTLLFLLIQEALELDTDDVYRPGSVLDMPKRPPWRHNMSKHELLSREEAYFKVCYINRWLSNNKCYILRITGMQYHSCYGSEHYTEL